MKTHKLVFISWGLLVLGWMSTIICQVADWLFLPLAVFLVFPFFAILALCLTAFSYFLAQESLDKKMVKKTILIQITLCICTFIFGIFALNELSKEMFFL